MKTLLVTSEITFVPRNYQASFEAVLNGASKHVWGILILKNLDAGLLKTILGLYALGAPRLAHSLIKNVLERPLKRREKLFRSYGKNIFYADSPNDPSVEKLVKDNDIDLIVNMRTRFIYKKSILRAPRLGCINIHHGLLPKYRGTMCDLMALAENRPAGFSIHRMTEKLDDGEILHCEAVSQGNEKDYVSYLARTGAIEGQALASILDDIAKNDKMPAGIDNVCDAPIYTKTPRSRAEVIAIKEKEVIL